MGRRRRGGQISTQGLLLNDFEAQALSLPAVPPQWTRQIGSSPFGGHGPQVILGPGTGLGIAGLIEAEGRFTPVSSEACHIDFGPTNPEEYAVWPHLERAHGRITSESVISGEGLARVHRARMMSLGKPDPRSTPPEVTSAALADASGEEAQSLRLYWRIVARFAGDMAVTFVAVGGVTLSGGVLPELSNSWTTPSFGRRSRIKRRSMALREACPPGSSCIRTRCWSAWRPSPRRPIAMRSITNGGAGFEPQPASNVRVAHAFAVILRLFRPQTGGGLNLPMGSILERV